MKNIIIIFILLVNSLNAQVGIGTTSPSATLDINGDLEIVSTPKADINLVTSSDEIILVKDLISNKVQKTSIKELYNNHLKSLIMASKGSDNQIALIAAGGTAQKLTFEHIEFDENSEYSSVTSEFTPKQDGWYDIEIQIIIEPTNPLSVTISNDFRLTIVKNSTEVLGSDRGLLTTLENVGSNVFLQPTRKIRTIAYLTTTDNIDFRVQNNNSLIPAAIDINVLGGSDNSYFMIKQIR